MNENLERSLIALKAAARELRKTPTASKDQALTALAAAVLTHQDEILDANAQDLQRLDAQAAPAFRDRLLLNPARLKAMAESLRAVASLPDPVGEVVEQRTLANGIQVRRVRSPLGLIFMIFESRPNVVLEAFSLAFKSGNAILLRGGSESKSTAAQLYQIMHESLQQSGFATPPFVGVQDYDRALVETLLKQKNYIDIVVPRGGDKLIEYVQQTALMPIIKNDRGLCHIYVDDEADLPMAVRIVRNAKVQRPGVCNSMETVLVHAQIAAAFLPLLDQATRGDQLQWRADKASMQILGAHDTRTSARPADWDTEHLDLIMNCKVVADLDEALAHIEAHGSKHSEAILTRSADKARRFQSEVDAAAVYWNASTRFTDGFELGLGGELGISTQKLHVRGPVGLRELTTPRWILDGTGQIRE